MKKPRELLIVLILIFEFHSPAGVVLGFHFSTMAFDVLKEDSGRGGRRLVRGADIGSYSARAFDFYLDIACVPAE